MSGTKISHNGELIAEVASGKTATLKCAGMQMPGDVVVETPEQTNSIDANIVPLTVTENGVYDTHYETADEIWDSNTEYSDSVTVDGVTLQFKKAAHLIVPDDLNELKRDKYAVVIESVVDGVTKKQQEKLRKSVNIIEDTFATWNEYAVLWVKNAAPLNAQLGISSLEDNTVYVTNYPQLLFAAYYEAQYVKVKVTAPSLNVENVVYSPVNVELPFEELHLSQRQGGWDIKSLETGVYYNRVTVDYIPTIDLIVTPLAVEQLFQPEEKTFYSSVRVESIALQEKLAKANGVITPDDGYAGLSAVAVEVSGANVTLQEKTITENSTVLPDAGYDGFSKVTVNVPIPDGYIKPGGTIEINTNGYYNVSNYSSVKVNTPTPVTISSVNELSSITPYDGMIAVLGR